MEIIWRGTEEEAVQDKHGLTHLGVIPGSPLCLIQKELWTKTREAEGGNNTVEWCQRERGEKEGNKVHICASIVPRLDKAQKVRHN